MTIKVSIVEDNTGIRESLKVLINGSEGYDCISAYMNAESALKGIPADNPDVVLMDINLPGATGIDCVGKLKEIVPDLNILMLTVFDDSERIFKALSAGANGYLLKRTSPTKLIEAINDVYNGGSPMSNQIARMVVDSFKVMGASKEESYNLSNREVEIVDLLTQGLKYKEIGEKLFIGTDTVRSHIRNIYKKLQVRSRTEAVVKYLKRKGE